MCDILPGKRCADDTCEKVNLTRETYGEAFAEGPGITPLMVEVLSRSGVLASKRTAEVHELVSQRRTLEAQRAALEELTVTANAKVDEQYARTVELHNRAGRAYERAMARIGALYAEHGAKFGRFYVSDIREARGLPVHEDLPSTRYLSSEGSLGAALRAAEPKVKVKRSGADAAATKAAAEAAKNDPELASALAEFRQARAELSPAYESYCAASQEVMAASAKALRTSREIGQVAEKITQGWADLDRIDAGVHPEAKRIRSAGLHPNHVVTYPDGTTNLWVETTDGDETWYEPVTGVCDEQINGEARQVLTTASGTKVLGHVHYANFTSKTTGVTVWVDPPREGAIPAHDTYPRLVLATSIDTGD